MHRFHIDPKAISNGSVTLDADESRHAISVLRLGEGDVVELIDGRGGRWRGVVAGRKAGRLQVSIDRASNGTAAAVCQLTLGVSLIKPERMEWLIQKSCELGVVSILPFVSERTVIRLPADRREEKLRRWQKIALESCKQCGRSEMPRIAPIRKFASLGTEPADYDRIFIATLAVPAKPLTEVLNEDPPPPSPKKILFLIGPEGDFTEEEAKTAVERHAEPVHLGPLVMRSETAGIYLASVLSFFYS